VSELLFDKLAYIDRLTRGGIPEPQARAHTEAMDAALHESVATRADIARLEAATRGVATQLEHKIELLDGKIDLAVKDLTIRVGVMLFALFSALEAARLFIR